MRNRIPKTGQSVGSGTSILILVILLLIIFYILFLPQAERDALLGEGGSGGTSSGTTPSSSGRLSPGVYLDERNIDMAPGRTFHDKDIPDVTLREIINAKELVALGQVSIKSSWFDKSFKNVTFRVPEYDVADNVILTFNVRQASGKLNIIVNGYDVFNEELGTGNSIPIRIDSRILYEDNNVIEFYVDGVGVEFWKANSYHITDIRMIGDITDESKQRSRNIFIMTKDEIDNVESAKLDFYTSCSGRVGTLDVELNSQLIYSDVPECRDFFSLQIPKDMLKSGENTVMFKVSSGEISIQRIGVKIDYRRHEKWRWSFHVNDADWRNINNSNKKVAMIVDFADDRNNIANFQINSRRDDFNVNNDYVRIDITRFINRGSNMLEIDPKSTFSVDRLRVVLED